MEKEIWKDVVGFEENYMISSFGVLKRKESFFIRTDGRIRKFKEKYVTIGFTANGYQRCSLQRTGCGKHYLLHRILAITFIPNPLGLPQVNHKNGIKHDNRVKNLEWCTNEENSRHSRNILGKDTGVQNRKPIICTTNGIRYDSARDAARKLKIHKSNIYNILDGRVTETKQGYRFIKCENIKSECH